MKHKHCELIKAWADGAEIEARQESGAWEVISKPSWNKDVEYRIKPEPRVIWVNEYDDGSVDVFQSRVCALVRSNRATTTKFIEVMEGDQ